MDNANNEQNQLSKKKKKIEFINKTRQRNPNMKKENEC